MTSHWTREHVARIVNGSLPSAPLIHPADLPPRFTDLDLWDFWPVQEMDGRTARWGDTELWMALSAPQSPDPLARHAHARIRLIEREGPVWRDRGDLFSDGFSPGSREWSGSAIVDPAHRILTVFFTAAGRRGEARPTYEQRLFQTRAALDGLNPRGWSAPTQSVASDGVVYDLAAQAEGKVGTIKAFRDPGFFRDPADGTAYLLFAASLGGSRSAFNGAVGLARADDATLDRWTLLPPLIEADDVNNELERPHSIMRDGIYYVFWSTQRSVFALGIDAPTGLYAMAAERFTGPYSPLNGSGLVLANPSGSPAQSYSWLVTDTFDVFSFLDDPTHGAWFEDAANGAAIRAFQLGPVIRLNFQGRFARFEPLRQAG